MGAGLDLEREQVSARDHGTSAHRNTTGISLGFLGKRDCVCAHFFLCTKDTSRAGNHIDVNYKLRLRLPHPVATKQGSRAISSFPRCCCITFSGHKRELKIKAKRITRNMMYHIIPLALAQYFQSRSYAANTIQYVCPWLSLRPLPPQRTYKQLSGHKHSTSHSHSLHRPIGIILKHSRPIKSDDHKEN